VSAGNAIRSTPQRGGESALGGHNEARAIQALATRTCLTISQHIGGKLRGGEKIKATHHVQLIQSLLATLLSKSWLK
jgi:hypothetical protein